MELNYYLKVFGAYPCYSPDPMSFSHLFVAEVGLSLKQYYELLQVTNLACANRMTHTLDLLAHAILGSLAMLLELTVLLTHAMLLTHTL